MIKENVPYLLLLVLLLTGACDTKDTIEPNYDRFFIKYFGADGDQTGQAIVTTSDAIYMAGTSIRSGGISEIYLVKSDLLGNLLWDRTYEREDAMFTVGMVIDPSGNLYIGANRIHNDAFRDFYILKTDAEGEVITEASFSAGDGPETFYDDVLESVTITADDDLILTGWTSNVLDKDLPSNIADVYSLRLNPDLVPYSDVEWRKRSGFRESKDLGKKIIQARSGGQFFFIGTTDKADGTGITAEDNLISFPLQPDGQFPAGDIINGTTNSEEASDIISTSGGDVVAMWNSSSGFNASTIYLAYANESENYQLQSGQPLPYSSTIGNSIIQSQSGGYIILGEQISNNNKNIFLIRTDQNFNPLWQTALGGLEDEQAMQVAELSDGSIVLTGTVLLESQTKMFLIKTKANGELQP
jgi:hypothetical protein